MTSLIPGQFSLIIDYIFLYGAVLSETRTSLSLPPPTNFGDVQFLNESFFRVDTF